MEITIRGKLSDFLIVTPMFLTSWGRKVCACEKRFWTSMLSMSFICCSIGVATDCSMVSASAPVNVVVKTTCGGMICGNCAIGRPSSETIPSRTVTIAITIATIGLLMKKRDMAYFFAEVATAGGD